MSGATQSSPSSPPCSTASRGSRSIPTEGTDPIRIDRIAALEKLRGAVAAAQQAEMVAFGRSQVEAHLADAAVHPRRVGRGIADQIALACRISPFTGSRRLGAARDLALHLPATRAALAAGSISEDVAALIVSETRHLDPEPRRLVDKQLGDAGLPALSPHRAAAVVKRFAYEADRAGYVERGRTARTDRRVGLRPAPDTMSVLTGFLPVEQGVACLAALRAHTDSVVATGDERSRNQIMADTLVERLTGQARAQDVSVEVGITMPVEALLDPEHAGTAHVAGQRPIPAGIAIDLLASTAGRTWWRRLFTSPSDLLVGGDARRRRFDGLIATLIRTRDGDRCRDPFCDAPSRHLDHIERWRDDGATTYPNGRCTCARGNYVREMPGRRVDLVEDGLGDRPHTVRITTPTGHSYTDEAPAP